MAYTLKVRKGGTGTLVVTVPKYAQHLEQIKEGDLVEVNFHKAGTAPPKKIPPLQIQEKIQEIEQQEKQEKKRVYFKL
jgi:hypothetical protein